MSMDIRTYITDHAAAGNCAYDHYAGRHDNSRCMVPAGTCTMISYLVYLLKQAEHASPVPLSPPSQLPAPGGPPLRMGPLPAPVSAPVSPPVGTPLYDSMRNGGNPPNGGNGASQRPS